MKLKQIKLLLIIMLKKIYIKIEPEIMPFYKLFYNCICLKSIKFLKFNKTEITDLSYMFYNYKYANKIDISKILTHEVKNLYTCFISVLIFLF